MEKILGDVLLPITCIIFMLVIMVLPISLIILITKKIRQYGKIGKLEQEIKNLKEEVGNLSVTVRKLISRELNTIKEVSEDITLDEIQPIKSDQLKAEQEQQKIIETEIKEEQIIEKIAPAEIETIKETKETSIQSKRKDNIESIIGGQILNRIGVIALILGVGFFLKYAFDNKWLSEIVQVMIGAIFGISLLAGGWHYYKKQFEVFSQGLIGAGIAILYLSAYAAYIFYHLVPHPIAILLMAAVTVVAFLQSVYYNSLAVAILGIIGGYITPFLFATPDPSAIGLFGYLLFLTISVALIVYKRINWKSLELLSIGATFIIFLGWFLNSYSDRDFPSAIIFLVISLILYQSLDVYRIIKNLKLEANLRTYTNIGIAVLFYFLIYLIVHEYDTTLEGPITLGLGALYLTGQFIMRTQNKGDENIYKSYVLIAVTLLVIATEQQFTGFTTIILYAIEALALMWLGITLKKDYLWKFALILLIGTTIKQFFLPGALSYKPVEEFIPFINMRSLAFIALIMSMLAGSIIAEKGKDDYKENLKLVLEYGWTALALMYLGIEINDYFIKMQSTIRGNYAELISFSQPLTTAFVWTVFSLNLLRWGINKRVMPFKVIGLFGLVISTILILVTGAMFRPLEYFIPVLNIRAIVFLCVIESILLVSKWFKGSVKPDDIESRINDVKIISSIMDYTWPMLIFILLSIEVNDLFAKLILGTSLTSVTELYEYYLPLGLAMGWSILSLIFIHFGINRDNRPLTIIGFGSLLIATIWGIYNGNNFELMDFYVPFLNLRFLTIVIIIATFIAVLKIINDKKKDAAWFNTLNQAINIIISVLIILLLSFETLDLFDLQAMELVYGPPGTESNAKIVFLKNLQQLTLSLVWLVYAILLLAMGILRKMKVLRITAMFLLAIAIVKIFAADLSFLQGLYRIASFIGLGVILMAVSYLYQRYKDIILGEDNIKMQP